jgi:hypothetical protein
MVFDDLETPPFIVQLIALSDLKASSFNPQDYLDFRATIHTSTSTLKAVADISKKVVKTGHSFKRVMSSHIDRSTGQVLQPTLEEFGHIPVRPFQAGDTLFHKVRARIGRIGIADFEGFAEGDIIAIRPHDIDPHYLTLVLRTEVVLRQLPFRETTRPRVRVSDVKSLWIPRIGGEVERAIGSFRSEMLRLREAARKILHEILDNLNRAIEPAMPKEPAFLVDVDELTENTLNPGDYVLDDLLSQFRRTIVLGSAVEVIQPHSLDPGNGYSAIALNDYSFEGVSPVSLQKTDQLWETNYAVPEDVLYNKLHSRGETPGKATVILPDMSYLDAVGLTVYEREGQLLVPVYPEIFILRLRPGAPISPYYLALVLNSELSQLLFFYMMGGTSGRQRLRKEKLVKVKIPLLASGMMEAFSEAVEICLKVRSTTLRYLAELSRRSEDVIGGEGETSDLEELIRQGNEDIEGLLASLQGIERAAKLTSKAILKT